MIAHKHVFVLTCKHGFNETYGGFQCSKYFPCLDLIPKWQNREIG